MITVDSQTLKLLDCPIMQKLRGIHQLGLSFLVYPSAEHSRFTHSLGVYYVSSRYVEEINKHPPGSSDELEDGLQYDRIDERQTIDLIHAALLHDIGHLPFSHATESIFAADQLRFRFGPYSVFEFMYPVVRKCGDVQLSECLSLAIVLSPRFKKFYNEVVRLGDLEAPVRIAALIAGQRLSPEIRVLSDLISSGLDADKIDYLCRDAESCNIPLGMDAARLFLRSACIKVPFGKIPESLRHPKDIKGMDLKVFVVNSSGIDTIEELAVGRASLYHRVYSHQTTRNAERLLAKALRSFVPLNGQLAPRESFGDVLHVWWHSDLELLNALAQQRDSELARTYGSRLRARRLLKRAGAFGPKLLAPVVGLESIFCDSLNDRSAKSTYKQIQYEYVEGFKFDSLKGKLLDELEIAIFLEAIRIRDKLKESGILDLPESEPGDVSVLPLPNLGHTKSECFILESDGHLSSSADYSTTNQLINAEEIGKLIGYVFTTTEWREIVFIAMRNVLFKYFDKRPHDAEHRLKPIGIAFRIDSNEKSRILDRFNVFSLPRFRIDVERACRRAKIPVKKVRQYLDQLARSDYFDAIPALTLPVPLENRLVTLARRFNKFDGERGWSVSEKSVQAFVSQFRPRFRDEAIRMIEGVTMIDRNTIRNHLLQEIEKVPADGSGKYIAPLSHNSGSFVRMLLEQEAYESLNRGGWTVCKTISEVLSHAEAGDTIVLCDDNVSTGTQMQCQFLAWAGKPRKEWPEEFQSEHGIEDVALRRKEIDTLRKMRIAVTVYAATEGANDVVSDRLVDLGFKNFLRIYFSKLISGDVSVLAELSEEFKEELAKIGAEVLLHCRQKGGLSIETSRTRVLGNL